MASHQGLLKRYTSALSVALRILDVIACAGASAVAYMVRFGSGYGVQGLAYPVLTLIAILFTLIVFPMTGLYRPWRAQHVLRPAGRAVFGWVIVFLLLLVLLVGTKEAARFSRVWLAEWFALQTVFLVLFRAAVYGSLARLRRRGFNRRNVVIVGSGEQAQHLVNQIDDWPSSGFVVAAVFNGADESAQLGGYRVQPLDKLKEFSSTHLVDEVWISLPLEKNQKLRGILVQLQDSTANVRFAPDLQDVYLLNRGMTDILNVPMIDLRATPMQGTNRLLKASEDRLLAGLILILVSPLMCLIALGVKLGSPGPVFYGQERVGWNGRIFRMLKFRSMRANAESQTGAMWANRVDDRTTPLGRFLRRTSLDELPQFINVLKGEMSIVGPRPERPVFVEQFKADIPGYMQKHVVKAGITGWAQVNGWRGRTDLTKRIEHDLYYIEHWSLWFDLRIIFLTVFKGFVNKNAY